MMCITPEVWDSHRAESHSKGEDFGVVRSRFRPINIKGYSREERGITVNMK